MIFCNQTSKIKTKEGKTLVETSSILHCIHGNERTRTHDVVCNTFATMAQDVNFHVGQEHLHTLPSTTFHSFCRWIEIVLTKDGIWTLANVVIVDPTWAYLLRWSCTTQGFVTFKAIQIKERSYHDQYPVDQFLFLTIEVFLCLNKQLDVFLHDCANAMWNFKRPKRPYFFCLGYFYTSKNLNYITKDATILHFKLSGNNRFNYFPTSTPLRHTPHHHS